MIKKVPKQEKTIDAEEISPQILESEKPNNVQKVIARLSELDKRISSINSELSNNEKKLIK